jgi:hypothetical protein
MSPPEIRDRRNQRCPSPLIPPARTRPPRKIPRGMTRRG